MLAQAIRRHKKKDGKLYPEDVFSTYLYTGNGSTQTINNGIDLAGEGGMVWLKSRSQANSHWLVDSSNGPESGLHSNQTGGLLSYPSGVSSFNSNGFTLGSDVGSFTNVLNQTHASWTFRKAPKFFTQEVKVHTNGTASTVDLSSLGEVGMITVKATSTTSNWYTWHRGLTAGNNLKLNLTDAQSTTSAYLSVSGTTLTIASTAPSATYIVYAWAHDTSADGIIQCGSFTTDGSGNATVNLGWEPQFVTLKSASNTGNWWIQDSMRGLTENGVSGSGVVLFPNLSNAENAGTASGARPAATGFNFSQGASVNQTFIYMAIRRPNKVPTSGTEVYNAIARTGTGAATTVTGVGFTPDLVFPARRIGSYFALYDRLRGVNKRVMSQINNAEVLDGNELMSFDMNGVSIGASSGSYTNESGISYINWFFRRAKGFFDIVCYTGTGVARTVNHNLGVVPELMIVKSRSGTTNWGVNYGHSKNTVFLNLSNAFTASATYWNSTLPTSSVFTVGTAAEVNTSSATYVAYLFASLAGVSKVGSYTGNGSSQTINCGFATGARFVLSKAVSTTGNWNIGDSTRGITSGTDPLLCLNTTAAEVTTDDWLDPESSGFIVNETASAHANTNGVQYVFLAIA